MMNLQDNCPHCSKFIDKHTSAEQAIPEPGSLSVCLYCSGLSVFDINLKLRKPTAEEISEYRSIPELWDQIKKYVVTTMYFNQPE